jgi:hypothetical protein
LPYRLAATRKAVPVPRLSVNLTDSCANEGSGFHA